MYRFGLYSASHGGGRYVPGRGTRCLVPGSGQIAGGIEVQHNSPWNGWGFQTIPVCSIAMSQVIRGLPALSGQTGSTAPAVCTKYST